MRDIVFALCRTFSPVVERDSERDVIFLAFLLQLVYDVDVVCRCVSVFECSLLSWLVFVEVSPRAFS